MQEVPIPSKAIGLVVSRLSNGQRDPSRPFADLISITTKFVQGHGRLQMITEDTEEFWQAQTMVWTLIRSRVRKINSLLGLEYRGPDLVKEVDVESATVPFGVKKIGTSGQSLTYAL